MLTLDEPPEHARAGAGLGPPAVSLPAGRGQGLFAQREEEGTCFQSEGAGKPRSLTPKHFAQVKLINLRS